MNTARRRLGTGPSSIRNTPTTAPAPRLLPAERIALSVPLEEDEHQDFAERKGRRTLGPGTERAQ
ncbi:hypothetical protein [Streptomyces chilikensis]|uniref:Uncharacterized protein n=1 Tax=Streptomyces chilikensis TaxID=1194079 RepID=A0ABV3EQ29_9ACTN